MDYNIDHAASVCLSLLFSFLSLSEDSPATILHLQLDEMHFDLVEQEGKMVDKAAHYLGGLHGLLLL